MTTQGTYAKLIPCDDSKRKLLEFISLLNITNGIQQHELHATLIYSRVKCDNVEDISIVLPVGAHGMRFEIYECHAGTKCLVLHLASDDLHLIHNNLRDNHGATHDYPSYNPHITLSYDFDDSIAPADDLVSHLQHLSFVEYVVQMLTFSPTDPHTS